ncbi:TetR/AcrR family transcriptional regulator [Agromyces archimandritae]|uniref:TetR family transcriptional regulator n=1 Tax=Agromyces archimandritae TaxID=2781962 RepID=A0A975IRF0_9MICO|nr:TetR/AcrR family transcriptional regulator [Agromyces archimandritae]QTX06021.1 TetR family transcriptional regulator [Agromyces archimandritae]
MNSRARNAAGPSPAGTSPSRPSEKAPISRADEPGEAKSTRARILDATARLIAERGFHAVRVSDVARELGISTSLVHYHFDGKHDLLNDALMHAVDRAFNRQSDVLKRIDDAHERLLTLIDMQLPRMGELRDEWSIWVQFWAEATVRPELRTAHQGYYDRWYETVQRTVQRGKRQNIFRSDVDPETVAHRLTAMTDGLAIQYLTGSPRITITAMKEILVRYISDELLPK